LAYNRKDVPVFAKIITIIAVGYALSPIDLVPDFIPILGYDDDLIILPILISIAIKMIPKNILEECKEEAKYLWKEGKPKRWYYGIPIIILWIVIAIIINNALRLTGLEPLRGLNGPSALRSARSLRSHASLRAHLGGRTLLRKALICPPKRRLQPERYAK
jgi:uncharacterized membrane protein YkvA (DUF1232 family)